MRSPPYYILLINNTHTTIRVHLRYYLQLNDRGLIDKTNCTVASPSIRFSAYGLTILDMSASHLRVRSYLHQARAGVRHDWRQTYVTSGNYSHYYHRRTWRSRSRCGRWWRHWVSSGTCCSACNNRTCSKTCCWKWRTQCYMRFMIFIGVHDHDDETNYK